MSSNRRSFALTVVFAASALSLGGPVPPAIKQRYKELNAVMNKVDFEKFKTFFSPDFVSIDPQGKKSDATEFFAAVKPLFDAAQKGNAREKLFSATAGKDGSVSVRFDMRLDLIGKKGTTKVHEVGVDTWKRASGKWVFIKTVDKAFTVAMPKGK